MIRKPGFVSRDHTPHVPLDHATPDGPTIEVFAREVVAADKAADGSADGLPWLLYLQGGPGGRSPRPVDAKGWLGRCAGDASRAAARPARHRAQHPVTARLGVRAAGCGDRRLPAPFPRRRHRRRCRAIPRRCSACERWDTLGQSYGGFITLTYLSRAPHALRTCYVTGGLPGIATTADEVYRRTFPRVAARTREFYRRYPRRRGGAARGWPSYLDETQVACRTATCSPPGGCARSAAPSA